MSDHDIAHARAVSAVVAAAWMNELIECGATEDEASAHVTQKLASLLFNEQATNPMAIGRPVLPRDQVVEVVQAARLMAGKVQNA